MGLFGIGKKKEEEKKCCCGTTQVQEVKCGCNDVCSNEKTAVEDSSSCLGGKYEYSVKVLGAGCKSCHEQHENVKKAVANMNLDAEIEYVTDMEKVMSYGVMSMPAIVVNDQVVSMGKVLKVAQVEELLNGLVK